MEKRREETVQGEEENRKYEKYEMRRERTVESWYI